MDFNIQGVSVTTGTVQYTPEELARAVHDYQNYPYPMPDGMSWEKLKKKAKEEYLNKANALIEIMEGYRENQRD